MCEGDASMVPFTHCLVVAERKATESLFGDMAFDKRPCEVIDQAVHVPGLGLVEGGSNHRCKGPETDVCTTVNSGENRRRSFRWPMWI